MARTAAWIVASAALVVALGVMPAAGAATAPTRPAVTVIADSVLTAVAWHDAPLAVLAEGLDLRLDAGVCRTLTGISCPFEGRRVPTLVEAVAKLGPAIAPTVVVEVGYSDDPATFAKSVGRSIDTLLAAGAKTIIWVNLHEAQPQYAGMNATLAAAAARHPEMWLLDWNGHAHERWSWFQGDGVHLTYDGAMAMARFLRDWVGVALAPPLAVQAKPMGPAAVGRPYATRLEAGGGAPPYAWRAVSGPLPKGLRLLRDGTISGTPRVSGRFVVTFRVTDTRGRTARLTASFVIARAGASALAPVHAAA